MTALKYLAESKVGTSSELVKMKTSDPAGFDTLIKWAKEEMMNHGIPIDEPVTMPKKD